MRRSRVLLLLAATAIVGAGCSEEDRAQLDDLEALVQEAVEAVEAAQSGQDSSPDDPRMTDADGDGEPDYDPDWNPDSFPPPPGEPDRSRDYTDQETACDPNQTCGWASYDDDDGEAILDHYEQQFGEPGDTREYPESLDQNGEPYNATQTTWTDGDTEVTVYTDHHGTDVHVRSAEG